jgi:putative transposase
VGHLAGVCKNKKIFVHEIGGVEDHLHMLIEVLLTISFSDALKEIKTSSSRWMGRELAWQPGFALFGVSASNLDTVIRYIRTQEAHHKKMTFEQEFIALLKKHRVAYDPRYVFG